MKDQKIPNIFHFINFGPREFNMVHFLSIVSAYDHNRPDKIYLYCDQEQEDNIFWEILKEIITPEKISVKSIKGIPLTSYEYQADVVRLDKLRERGGVYMDMDILSLKPIKRFFNKSVVMGIEKAYDPNENNIHQIDSISNALIMSEPDNDYIKQWYEKIPENLVGKQWAYHAVVLPKKLLEEDSTYDVTLKPTKNFIPFCFRDPYIFQEENKYKKYLLDESYTIHLWENIWKREGHLSIDVEYFNTNDNIFVDLFKKYMDILYQYLELIENIINKCYEEKKYEKVIFHGKMYIDLCNRYKRDIEPNILSYYKFAFDKVNDN